MELTAYLTLAITASVLLLLIFTNIASDLVLMLALVILVVSDILAPAEALAGFSNPGVMTIAALYVVAAGLKETGAVQWLANFLLGYPQSGRAALFRLFLPSSSLSAFMNNTAVVAMFIPAIQGWAVRLNISPSRLLLPLSYAAILGGTCTLIGTSTNLVIDGLLRSEKAVSLGMFELAWVGVPVLLVGGCFVILFGHKLLPDRVGIVDQLERVREYTVELIVESDGPVSGRSVAEAGLRHLQHGYLVDVQRNGKLLAAVPPETQLYAADVLVFVGSPECAHELRSFRGLTMVNGDAEKLDVALRHRCLVEALIGPEFSGLNRTVKDARFRSRFQAAILSVSREGRRLDGKIGDIRLQVGDTLLLEASRDFVSQYRSRRDFLLVSMVNDQSPPDFDRAPYALAILMLMVCVSATGLLSILEAAFLAAGGMLLTGCLSAANARRSVDLTVLVVIAASFSIGMAMDKTGAAQHIAGLLLFSDQLSPLMALVLIYVMTVVFTEAITNNAAAVLMFPIAVAVAEQMQVNFMPFVIAVMFAASASFITPLGYQTNLMVMGPGGYRVSDYLRLGLPLSMVVAVTSIPLIPMIWVF
ncbi:SLC13 family permease [Amphritea sp. HPY]|uniref:SLC13 family permease n=1 Tax=Amphritea sp. HPY TaxID=3421652 RepID=UPI003D7E2231